MNPPSFLLSFFLVLTYFTSCLGVYHEKNSHTVSYHSLPASSSLLYRKSRTWNRHRQQARGYASSVNVDEFGAKADGSDDSEAFKKAWNKGCSSSGDVVIIVPKNRMYTLKPVTFSGPCKSRIIFKIHGTIKASAKTADYARDRSHWIVFQNVENFRVKGGGTINGSGKIWWKNSCKINESLPCIGAPTAVTFDECKNLIVSNLKFLNAQQMHLSFEKCLNVRALNLLVIAPEKSPNTDGIHVTGTQNIRIQNCVIRTGDDCISIVSGSKNVQATDITCGPGHGISIGSLGAGKQEARVSNVFVNRATLSGTTNGVRIKTWQGGSGFAKNIVFQNIALNNVSNPIIINQNYCDQKEPCKEQRSAVQVSNVMYRNIVGTSASEVAVKFDCSKTFPCRGVVLQNINLNSQESGERATASCDNVNFAKRGSVSPQCS
ncbi:hypothetical protein K2173_011343 [Erythroxylum novogranatense]|uniref:endo-polygalacturonase n=1 Tax=Erythroxylum novogranatense TaxID=1862640 RepID=A0AAV8S9R7_9ROSI|nr:hypothetical protein K2173_011343 [Erythroxylum novogranatense]